MLPEGWRLHVRCVRPNHWVGQGQPLSVEAQMMASANGGWPTAQASTEAEAGRRVRAAILHETQGPLR